MEGEVHISCDQFIQHYSIRPEINFAAIRLASEYFRGGICGRAEHIIVRYGIFLYIKLACEAKVAQNNMPIVINKDVLGLYISMDDSFYVRVLERQKLVETGQLMNESYRNRYVRVLPYRTEPPSTVSLLIITECGDLRQGDIPVIDGKDPVSSFCLETHRSP
jgi:hypothetical protein